MSYRIRAARLDDLQHIYEMAKLTGGGFTNLPADKQSLTAKLERSQRAYDRTNDEHGNDLFVMVLENIETGVVRGTSQLFTKVGQSWPFYSYRLSTLSQTSKELDRTFSAQMLSLVTDLEGSSEVGGLFLHPNERAGGLGMLLARSRYLFIKEHRQRFGDKIFAELRGVIDEAGGSPFWDGLAGRFFGMNFQDADYFNAIHGNQFIADLMPKHPIYTAMLSETARAAIGVPHPNGRAAMRMLENENFSYDGYVDIFDGGPTMIAKTNDVTSIRKSKLAVITGIDEGTEKSIISRGNLGEFQATYAMISENGEGVTIDAEAASNIGLSVGDEIRYIAR
ncbi:arginine N-succinyltransferase [Parasphingorhabdus halotolerans]|uniref:Arginine N-succinyltransferase n=1 Tax=Parasphingorhabdus halotolerans TaxID=2725558 RepID=A0A6H2DRF9_9SPHN|nr:arginine N-succinyltransferase [Parasphingorhabdus halotolerans]QJB70535.1 arginine N-succinyltransferase [Parasphingorhabdus halotolerans]